MNDKIIVVFPKLDGEEKVSGPYWKVFRQTCHHYGLKFQFISLDELEKYRGCESPVILAEDFSAGYIQHICETYPDMKLITPLNIERGRWWNISSVACDAVKLTKDVVSYCVEAGKKHFALFAFDILGVRTNPFLEGYKKAALEIAGNAIEEEDIFLNDGNMLTYCFEKLYARIERYDTIICVNDLSALYVITELQKRGIRVPRDMFVIGYSNSPLSRDVSPSITSIEISEQKRAELCVLLWRFMQKNANIQNASLTVEHGLIVRESTAFFHCMQKDKKLQIQPTTENGERGYGGALQGLHVFLRDGNAVDRAIVSMIMEGRSTVEISEALYMTEGTVKYRIKNILKMFSVRTKSELCAVLKYYNVVF